VSETVPAIYAAMHKVMQGVANIPKSGEMKFGATNYKYLRADDVQEKLNPLLTENGIVVNAQYTVRDAEKGNRHWVYVDLDLSYISTEDGSVFPVVKATGESIAGDDKSVNKALTQAIKNAHRATFQFASGEPEPDDLPPGTQAPATPRTTPAQAKVDRAKGQSAPGRGGTLQNANVAIRKYIGTDGAKKDAVNARMAELKAEGKTELQQREVLIEELGLEIE
jgi:hypothetical protein